jgi:hypothetical protein
MQSAIPVPEQVRHDGWHGIGTQYILAPSSVYLEKNKKIKFLN